MASAPPAGSIPPPAPEARGRSGLWKIVALAVALVLIVLLVLSPLLPMMLGFLSKPTKTYPQSAHFWVNRTISISVDSGGAVDLTLDVPIPPDLDDSVGNAIQDRQVTEPDPLPLVEAKAGATWMVWDAASVTEFAATISYEFETRTVWWESNAELSGTPSQVPQRLRSAYLGEEWKIRPSDPQIVALAADIASGLPTVHERLRAIYEYLDSNIAYEASRSGSPKDCTETLADGSGDCDDQSILFCSIARAANVPAWLEFGALYDRVIDAWGAHAWVQAYLPSTGGGGLVNIDVVNDEFLVRGANRYTEWTATGVATDLMDYYTFVNYSYTQPHPPELTLDESFTGRFVPSEQTITVPLGAMAALPGLEPFLAVSAVAATGMVLLTFKRRAGRAR